MKRRIMFSVALTLLLSGSANAQEVFVFPSNGQNEQQMNQDKGECSTWAKQQSGFDPMNPPNEQQLVSQAQQQSAQPQGGGGVAAGMAKGAITGSAIGLWTDNDRTNYGAAGAFIGGVRAGRRQEQAAAQQQKQAQQQAKQQADEQLQNMRNGYNRAYSACLEGKGYTTR